MTESAPVTLTDEATAALAHRLLTDALASNRRLIVGIAGIAGSGKTTLGEKLTDQINRDPHAGANTAAFIPMDGFHLSNATLTERGWKPRKGAAFTYDADAYADLLRRFADPSSAGGFPVYCREVHEPVASEQTVGPETRIVVTEGQYLLSSDAPWAQLESVLDETWWLDVEPEHARRWLMRRDTAVGRSVAEAEAKYRDNDRLNTQHVLSARRIPDLILRWPDDVE